MNDYLITLRDVLIKMRQKKTRGRGGLFLGNVTSVEGTQQYALAINPQIYKEYAVSDIYSTSPQYL